MRLRSAAVAVLLLAGWVGPASAHPMPNSLVALRFHRDGVEATLTLPLGELRTAWNDGPPLPDDAAEAVRLRRRDLARYVGAHVHATAPDGRPWAVSVRDVQPGGDAASPDLVVTVSLVPPAGSAVDRFQLGYDVISHRLLTHRAVVAVASDWRRGLVGDAPAVVLGTLRDTSTEITVDRSGGSWVRGFAAVFALGARHIAEGTDHLLFLLALILPAPLVVAPSGWRWGGPAGGRVATRRILRVVTAFTLGHSLTLVLGAVGWVHLPDRLVESAIAVSIVVSAVHALVPILRGGEVAIAAGFGLVHGLAFAATLADFGLDGWTVAATILGFNLGIEAVQILLVVATMPWLVLLAQTPRVYTPVRVGAAAGAVVAAGAWFAERAVGLANPVAPWVEAVAGHPVALLGGLVGLTLLTRLVVGLVSGGSPGTEPAPEAGKSGFRLAE